MFKLRKTITFTLIALMATAAPIAVRADDPLPANGSISCSMSEPVVTPDVNSKTNDHPVIAARVTAGSSSIVSCEYSKQQVLYAWTAWDEWTAGEWNAAENTCIAVFIDMHNAQTFNFAMRAVDESGNSCENTITRTVDGRAPEVYFYPDTSFSLIIHRPR